MVSVDSFVTTEETGFFPFYSIWKDDIPTTTVSFKDEILDELQTEFSDGTKEIFTFSDIGNTTIGHEIPIVEESILEVEVYF